ncbi:MAG: hypothetical protein ACOZJX_08585 [Pseudomonadota bacterium]
MKLLRVWLLVLLTVLLPIRGGMAAAMLCPPAGAAGPAGLMQHQGGHGHGVGHESGHGSDHEGDHAHGHHAAHGGAAGAGTDPAAHAHADGCDLCSASCACPPLPSAAVSGVPEPRGLKSAGAPDPVAPAPRFLSGGLERPPRSA